MNNRKMREINQHRMDGALWLMRVIDDKGLEYAKKELMRRGAFKLDLVVCHEDIENVTSQIEWNMMQSLRAAVLFVLSDKFGFGKVRLNRFLEKFDELCEVLGDWDTYGDSYLTFSDMAKELKEKYQLDINTETIYQIDEQNKEASAEKRDKLVMSIMKVLSKNNYPEAANFLLRWYQNFKETGEI
jgi:hypothetical protein